jgi:hypothetical protein
VLGAIGAAALVLTQEPTPPAVAAALASASVSIAALASLLLWRYTPRTRAGGRGLRRARALRRGAEIGATCGLIAVLQAIGGLTPVTGLFVILSFAIAEYLLSAGASSSA